MVPIQVSNSAYHSQIRYLNILGKEGSNLIVGPFCLRIIQKLGEKLEVLVVFL